MNQTRSSRALIIQRKEIARSKGLLKNTALAAMICFRSGRSAFYHQAMDKQLFQAHPWHGVTPGPRTPELLNAFIEIVPTDAVKYELDKWSGHLRVDRPQRFSSMSPTLYGFIPQTYCGREVGELCALRTGRSAIEGDKDPMDICVLSEKTFAYAGFFLHARPIGGLRMIDGNQADDKIIAVLDQDLAYGKMMEVRDVPHGLIDRLKH